MPKILQSLPTPSNVAVVSPPSPSVAERAVSVSTTAQAVKSKKEPRPVRFPEIMINGVVIPRANLRVTVANARKLLNYETEDEYRRRAMSTAGGSEDMYAFRPAGMSIDHKLFARLATAHEAHFTDPAGNLVICWRNANNRPLDIAWVRELMQDMAERGWKMNCENVIVSKTGLVISGQHRLIALVWLHLCWSGAAQGDQWRELRRLSARHWGTEEPYIESLVACGADEDIATLMTLDNTKARSDADNFVQLELFDDWTRDVRSIDAAGNKVWADGPLSAPQKRELGNSLSKAVEFLWLRTGAGSIGDSKRFKSKKATLDFTNAHSSLLKCLRHIWEENGGRRDTGGSLKELLGSPGECAAIEYLMASCRSDGAKYRDKPSVADRNEEGTNWSEMDRARMFWSQIAASTPNGEGSDETKALFKPLHTALGMICDPHYGLTQNGTPEERHALLAKAWTAYLTKGNIEEMDLALRYKADVDQDGRQTKKWLDESPKFGGIDVGPPVKKAVVTSAAPPTREQVEEAKREAARLRQLEDMRRSEPTNGSTPEKQAMEQAIGSLKAAYPGKLLILVSQNGRLVIRGTDAEILSGSSGFPMKDHYGTASIQVDRTDVQLFLGKVGAIHQNAILLRKLTTPDGQPVRYEEAPATHDAWCMMVGI